jgi:hypothetical protein
VLAKFNDSGVFYILLGLGAITTEKLLLLGIFMTKKYCKDLKRRKVSKEKNRLATTPF